MHLFFDSTHFNEEAEIRQTFLFVFLENQRKEELLLRFSYIFLLSSMYPARTANDRLQR